MKVWMLERITEFPEDNEIIGLYATYQMADEEALLYRGQRPDDDYNVIEWDVYT